MSVVSNSWVIKASLQKKSEETSLSEMFVPSVSSQQNFCKMVQHFSSYWFIAMHVARVPNLEVDDKQVLNFSKFTFGLSSSLSSPTPLVILMPRISWPSTDLPTCSVSARRGYSSASIRK